MNPISLLALIFIVLCGIVIIITTRRAKAPSLDKLEWLPDEKIILTEDVSYEAMIRGTEKIRQYYPKGNIILTNKRIILAQAPLFQRKSNPWFALRFVINFADRGPELTSKDFLNPLASRIAQAGHVPLFTTKDRITFPEYKGKPVVEITTPMKDHGPFFREPKIRVFSKNAQLYKKKIAAI